MKELQDSAKPLVAKGWVVERLCLEVEESENGVYPRGVIVVRYDPCKIEDVL